MKLDLPRSIVACPHCRASLDRDWFCSNPVCPYHTQGFPKIDDVPVLVDFERSIIPRRVFVHSSAASTKDRRQAGALVRWIKEFTRGRTKTPANVKSFAASVKALADHPLVLVVGGGEQGRGTEELYADDEVGLVITDIYKSEDTVLVADGHALPFKDGSFDGVWIQAVLEHVLNPHEVVAEIHRILKSDGVVYAQTPFMAQVHEGAYDFTRFTVSGHRWLFRRFEELSSGTARGPGTVLKWSIRYYFAALFRSYKVGSLCAIAFSWVQFFDRFMDQRFVWDGASGTFFLGRKSNKSLAPPDIVEFYRGAQ